MKQEFFIKNEMLIKQAEWTNAIGSLSDGTELDDSEEAIASKLRKMVDSAIIQRIEGLDNVGIYFSGGLDSSYIAAICKKSKVNFTCYTVGFQDGYFKEPEDIVQASLVAKHLNLTTDEFKARIFNLKEIEQVIKRTVEILKAAGVNNVVNAGVGSVEVAAHLMSKGEQVFFSGLGSEEIFAGYERHKLNPTNDECKSGLLNMYERDLIRDTAIPRTLGFAFTTPFLDEELVGYSLRIPIKYKINTNGNKTILRKASEPYLGRFSQRPKKAAQYGSSIDRAIAKLAKINGFEKKIKYIESL